MEADPSTTDRLKGKSIMLAQLNDATRLQFKVLGLAINPDLKLVT